MFLSYVFGGLFWVATLVLVLGIAFKVRLYWKTPAPLKIPTTPAPLTQGGVFIRMFKEVVFFFSLFRANKLLWVLGIGFHYALALVCFVMRVTSKSLRGLSLMSFSLLVNMRAF